MKKSLFLLALVVMSNVQANAADVGVSVSIGQPGFYGRLDFGTPPPQPPQLIYAQPVVVQPPPRGARYAPMYLHVPPGEARNWRRYCHRYGACGHPVYFVQDGWYNKVYVPHYQRTRGEEGHPGRGHAKGHRERGS